MAGPDEGYAWLVAFACFFINFTMAGLARSVSILYLALVEMYGVTRQEATLPFSLRASVRNMSGPLIGLLGLKYGIRPITAIGGFVAALGSILCYFAPNILWITVFWGIVHGIGFGLSTVMHMMIISQYFDKYKASALGLGYSGDCFGAFAFPVILETLLDTYDLRGTFLILGGIVLHVIPMAMILKKPPWLKRNSTKGKYLTNIVSKPELNIDIHQDSKKQGICNEAFVNSKNNICDKDLYQIDENDSISVISDSPSTNHGSVRKKFPRTSLPFNSSPRGGSRTFNRKSSDLSDIIRDYSERQNSLPPLLEKEVLSSGNFVRKGLEKCLEEQNQESADDDIIEVPPSNVKSRRASSITQIAQDFVNRMRSASFASQCAQDGFMIPFQLDLREDSIADISEDEVNSEHILNDSNLKVNEAKVMNTKTQDLISPVNGVSQGICDSQMKQSSGIFKLFIKTNLKPIFILICLSMAVYSYLYIGVLTIIIDYAVDNNVSHEGGKYLIIGYSVTDLLGRLSFGQVLDRKLLKMKNYAGITLLLMGTLVAAIPLHKSFNFMIVIMSMYGFMLGGTAIMFPILVNYYMKKEEEAVAMGCLNFYGGLLMLLLAPMIGFFRDNTGSYDWVFHIMGIVVLVVGLIWQLEPLIIKYQNNRKLRKTNQTIITKL